MVRSTIRLALSVGVLVSLTVFANSADEVPSEKEKLAQEWLKFLEGRWKQEPWLQTSMDVGQAPPEEHPLRFRKQDVNEIGQFGLVELKSDARFAWDKESQELVFEIAMRWSNITVDTAEYRFDVTSGTEIEGKLSSLTWLLGLSTEDFVVKRRFPRGMATFRRLDENTLKVTPTKPPPNTPRWKEMYRECKEHVFTRIIDAEADE